MNIGNPPFGHAGERVLDELAKDYGGFEGNAQTFRVLTRLERKYPDCEGLNLTHRTLLGVVKYFQKRPRTNKKFKKFLYDEDYKLVKELRKEPKIKDKTLDCAIMEIADDIANNAHDLEDVLHQKLINTEDIEYLLNKEKDNKSGIFKGYGKKNDTDADAISVFQEIRKHAIEHAKVCVIESHDEFETLLRKELVSQLVNRLVDDVDVVVQKGGKRIVDLKSLKPLTKLNHLLLNAVKVEADIDNYEHIGERVIRGLYDVYADKKYNPKNVLLPHPYRNGLRGVIDYISGMTDQFALEQYQRFYGHDVYEDGFYIKSKHKKKTT
jgi:dGTPase